MYINTRTCWRLTKITGNEAAPTCNDQYDWSIFRPKPIIAFVTLVLDDHVVKWKNNCAVVKCSVKFTQISTQIGMLFELCMLHQEVFRLIKQDKHTRSPVISIKTFIWPEKHLILTMFVTIWSFSPCWHYTEYTGIPVYTPLGCYYWLHWCWTVEAGPCRHKQCYL